MKRTAVHRAFWLAVALVFSSGANAAPEPPPKSVGMVERVERRLGQVDVAISGPPDRITGLTLQQFELTIGGKEVVPTALDALCSSPSQLAPTAAAPGAEPAATPTSFLFYFDQRNLTMAGRALSLETARGLIEGLIKNGNRGSIVSSGKRLDTLVNFTEDPGPLIAALDRIREDHSQWDTYPSLEGQRRAEIGRALQTSAQAACLLARSFQQEELRKSKQAIELFQSVLTRFADLGPPKVAVYFADTMRDEPGRHYGATFGCTMIGDSFLSFQRLHGAASAYGVKVYAVQARGFMVSSMDGSTGPGLRDSQDGLKAIALETGGDAFLNGAGVDAMVSRIERDAACVYVLSFDPAPFPEDKLLTVDVRVHVPGVRARTRTHLVLQSASARKTATLLAAFTESESAGDVLTMRGGIVPLDVDGRYLKFLVQASVPETRMAQGETWDLGMSLVSGADVPGEASGRIQVDRPGVKLVLESEMEVEPGAYEVVLVGSEATLGGAASGRISGTWGGRIGPSRIVAIAMLQPGDGAFLRDGQVRRTGSLVIPDGEAARVGRPTAFVTLVCRGDKRQRTARVQRTLTGPVTQTFEPVELSLAESACAQVRDVIPANTLAAGTFNYTIAVDGAEAGEARSFVVE